MSGVYSSYLRKSKCNPLEKTKPRDCAKLCAMSRNRDARSIDAIAARLIATRKALEMNQSAFAATAGVKNSTYNQWEKAKGRPGLDDAIKLSDAYGLTLDWIYFGDPSGLPVRLVGKIVLT